MTTVTIAYIVILLIHAWTSSIYIYHKQSSDLKELIKLDREIGTSPSRAVKFWPGILPACVNLAGSACMGVAAAFVIGHLLAASV